MRNSIHRKLKNKNTYFRVARGLWKFLVAIGHECDDLQYTKTHTALTCRKLTFSVMIGCHKSEFTRVVYSCIQVMENIESSFGKRDFSVVIWFFVYFLFKWSIIDLWCCISFRCAAMWFNCIHMYKTEYTYIFVFQILSHYRLLWDIEYSPPCYIVVHAVYLFCNAKLLIYIPPFPLWQPKVCSLFSKCVSFSVL